MPAGSIATSVPAPMAIPVGEVFTRFSFRNTDRRGPVTFRSLVAWGVRGARGTPGPLPGPARAPGRSGAGR